MKISLTIEEHKPWLFGFLLWLCCGSSLLAQENLPYRKFLNETPYFAAHKALPGDSLFQQDLKILHHYLQLDSIDSELLKPPVLAALMIEQSRAGKPATFKTLIAYLKDFKTTIAYKDFRKGVVFYKSMENKVVDLTRWETDKEFFVKLGFTEGDLEDLKIYLEERARKGATYKEAYVGYIKEIEAL